MSDGKESKKITAENFIEIVNKSKLVEKTDVESTIEEVKRAAGGKLPPSATVVAERFLVKGLLSAWQIEKLMTGKYKGFFLGKFKLLGHIGSGGMSSVYLAEHRQMNDLRAIKVLPKKRVNDATYLARFQLEAKAIASLSHDNIVRAFDIDNDGDLHYIVMEYVNGDDLQEIVKRRGPMDFKKAADYIAQAARGLQHAHDRGLIHRDVKPANLLVNKDGKIKLLDMGLALLDSEEDHSLTVANNENVLGTADYLAPEQALNSHNVDHRVDVYGLGCTMYFLLTGRPPFTDGTLAQRIVKHQTEMPDEIRKHRVDCPGELEGICTKMLQKEPRYRYKTAADVAEVLEGWLSKLHTPVKSTVGSGPGSSGSNINVGSSDSRGSDIGIGSSNDTVSSKGSDTFSGISGSDVFSDVKSPSDSGRMIKSGINKGIERGNSAIDLEVESGYVPKKPRAVKPHSGPKRKKKEPQRKIVPLAGSAAAANQSAPGQTISMAQNMSEFHPAFEKRRKQRDLFRKIMVFFLVVGAMCFGWFANRLSNRPAAPERGAEEPVEITESPGKPKSSPLTPQSADTLMGNN